MSGVRGVGLHMIHASFFHRFLDGSATLHYGELVENGKVLLSK